MGRAIILSCAVLMSLATVFLGPQANAQQANSTSMIDWTDGDGYRPAKAPASKEDYRSEGPGYNSALEARSRQIFPWMSQESQRQQWMADQEQRAIANEINKTKPLLYPMSGR